MEAAKSMFCCCFSFEFNTVSFIRITYYNIRKITSWTSFVRKLVHWERKCNTPDMYLCKLRVWLLLHHMCCMLRRCKGKNTLVQIYANIKSVIVSRIHTILFHINYMWLNPSEPIDYIWHLCRYEGSQKWGQPGYIIMLVKYICQFIYKIWWAVLSGTTCPTV